MKRADGVQNSKKYKWFAWHPVKTGEGWVWLRYVERRITLYVTNGCQNWFEDWEYR